MTPLVRLCLLAAGGLLLAGCGQLPARYLDCHAPQQYCYRANTIDHEYTQFHYRPRGVVRLHQDRRS